MRPDWAQEAAGRALPCPQQLRHRRRGRKAELARTGPLWAPQIASSPRTRFFTFFRGFVPPTDGPQDAAEPINLPLSAFVPTAADAPVSLVVSPYGRSSTKPAEVNSPSKVRASGIFSMSARAQSSSHRRMSTHAGRADGAIAMRPAPGVRSSVSTEAAIVHGANRRHTAPSASRLTWTTACSSTSTEPRPTAVSCSQRPVSRSPRSWPD